MKLIIGGAFQGKLAYAMETYHARDGWIDGKSCEPEEVRRCRGIYGFHEYLRRVLKNPDCEEITAIAEPKAADTGQRQREEDAGQRQTAEDTSDFLELEHRAERFAEALYRENPEILIVSNELGYGVVPLDKSDRIWREFVGRVCTCLAMRADEVVRVVCGVGMRMK